MRARFLVTLLLLAWSGVNVVASFQVRATATRAFDLADRIDAYIASCVHLGRTLTVLEAALEHVPAGRERALYEAEVALHRDAWIACETAEVSP